MHDRSISASQRTLLRHVRHFLRICPYSFYVNAFFFVSGYLFFRKQLSQDRPAQGLSYRRTLANIVFRLVIPTLLFSTLIYIPKKIFHQEEISILQYLLDVWGGTSYWFTSALAVAQITLLTLLRLCGKRTMGFYAAVSVVLTGFGWACTLFHPGHFPWFYQTGLGITCLMTAGGLYQQYETKVNRFVKPYMAVAAFLAYLVGMVCTWENHNLHTFLPDYINLQGSIVLACSLIWLIPLARIMPANKWCAYIGRNSIVFYFLSGVTPAMYASIAHMLFPGTSYGITFIVMPASLLTSAAACLIINRWMPFLLDIRLLFKKK